MKTQSFVIAFLLVMIDLVESDPQPIGFNCTGTNELVAMQYRCQLFGIRQHRWNSRELH